jgi:hypothetical protein
MAFQDLVDFWNNEAKLYEQTLLPAARQALGAAQVALVQPQKAADDAIATLAKIQKQIADVNKRLADEPSPADAAADAATMLNLVVQLRNQNGVVQVKGEALFDAKAKIDRAKAAVDRLAAKTAEVKAGQAALLARDTVLRGAGGWHEKLQAAPFVTLKVDAGNAAAATVPPAPRGAALARVSLPDYPDELSKLAGQRAGLVHDQLRDQAGAVAGTEALMVAHLKTAAAADPVGSASYAFERAFTKLGDYLHRAKEDFDRALGLYAQVAAKDPLSANERLSLGALPTVADLDLEDTRNKKIAALAAAQKALDAATETAQKDDPTTPVTPDATLNGAVTIAGNELETAQSDFAGGAHPTAKDHLDAWQAALPDDGFRSLAAFNTADQILKDLAAIDPAQLETDVDNAAGALATALAAGAKADRTTAYLRDQLALQNDRYTHALESRAGVLLGRVRGDV